MKNKTLTKAKVLLSIFTIFFLFCCKPILFLDKNDVKYYLMYSSYVGNKKKVYRGFVVNRNDDAFFASMSSKNKIRILDRNKIDYTKKINPKIDIDSLNKRSKVIENETMQRMNINHCYPSEIIVYNGGKKQIFNAICPDEYQKFVHTKDRQKFIQIRDSILNYSKQHDK